ncbi:MAG TPA: 50S ribosomal protein L15 [Pseudomonadota bacterium]|jgi:large subunit ribosomal protein L15|nr:50S ribosomal protein L15 [Pseudomonadota bacterium]
MGTSLHTLAPNPGANRPKKRLGRGHGSGLHKTSGKGTKGQKARTGHHGIPKPGFEGGQTAMARRLPKRGFNNPFRREVFAVNLGDIASRFPDTGSVVGLEQLKSAGLVPRSAKLVKVLGSLRDGLVIPQKMTVGAHFISASAREKLIAAMGSFQEIAVRVSSADVK